MTLEINRLGKSFDGVPVLDGLTLAFPDKAITVILGPSGSGKTTLLRCLSGLVSADSGSIAPEPSAFSKSFVFQEPRLIPTSSALENVAYGLEAELGLETARSKAEEMLGLVGLADALGARPRELSGGMSQRVSLARAFATPSDVLFMDEPFQALDLGTRVGVMDSFLGLWKRDPRTTVFVTHDIQEAMYLGDRIIVLSPRPARALRVLDLGIGRECRAFGSGEMETVERELYDLALARSCPD